MSFGVDKYTGSIKIIVRTVTLLIGYASNPDFKNRHCKFFSAARSLLKDDHKLRFYIRDKPHHKKRCCWRHMTEILPTSAALDSPMSNNRLQQNSSETISSPDSSSPPSYASHFFLDIQSSRPVRFIESLMDSELLGDNEIEQIEHFKYKQGLERKLTVTSVIGLGFSVMGFPLDYLPHYGFL